MKIFLWAITLLLLIAVDSTVATKQSNEGVRPALHDAIVNKNLDLLRQLLSSPDVDVNVRDRQKASPLHFAVLTGLKYVELLLTHPSIDVNARDKHNLTPLHYATFEPKSFSKYVVAALLKYGANIEAVGSDQKVTPLHMAVMANNTQLVRLLVKSGAKVNVKSVSGKTVLQGASTSKNRDLVHALLTAKTFKLSDYTEHYNLLAYSLPHSEVLRTFLEFGFDATARDTEFNKATLLHLAATLGPIEVRSEAYNSVNIEVLNKCQSVKVLLEFNADVNARDGWLKTPLHYAVYNKQNDIANYLLDHGANHQLQDDAGITPYNEAVQAGNIEMIELLQTLDSDEKIEL